MTNSPGISDLIQESYALERAGDIAAALRRAQMTLEKARASAIPADMAAARVCLAHIEYHLGRYGRAKSLAERALASAADDTPPRADALRILGDCAHEAGDLAAAEGYYRQAIDCGRRLGHPYILHRCLHSLSACVYIPRGQFELALAADRESHRLALDLNMTDDIWLPLVTLGWVYWVTGRREQALEVVEEMRQHAPQNSLAEGYYLCLRGDLAQDGDDPGSALSQYAGARAIAEAVGDPGLNAELRVGLSRYHRLVGSGAAAHSWADDALTIATRSGCQDIRGWALIERARAAWAIGELEAAEADLCQAIELARSMGASFDRARALLLLAALLFQQDSSAYKSAWIEASSLIISGGYAFLLDRERSWAFPLLAAGLNGPDPDLTAMSARLLNHLETVSPPRLQVVTLGRFQVRQDARLIPDQAWRVRRAGELFRLLLISPGRTLFRDQVAEALWPERPPSSTPALFHKATSALRRALEPDLPEKFPSRYLEVEEGRVTLRLPAGSRVDFQDFEQHVQNREWEAATELYRGELYPGDRYRDWAAGPRERLVQNYVRAALAAGAGRLAAGQFDRALDACRRILALDPWQEEVVLLGMRACVALNNRAGAIRLYQDLERTLQKEFGISPQVSLQTLYQSLL